MNNLEWNLLIMMISRIKLNLISQSIMIIQKYYSLNQFIQVENLILKWNKINLFHLDLMHLNYLEKEYNIRKILKLKNIRIVLFLLLQIVQLYGIIMDIFILVGGKWTHKPKMVVEKKVKDMNIYHKTMYIMENLKIIREMEREHY